MQSVCLFNISIKNQCFTGQERFTKSAYLIQASPAANTNTAACLSDLLQLPNWIQLLAINYLALQSKADYLSICPAAQSIFRDFRNKRAREDRTALLIINVSQTNVSVTNMFVLDCVLLRVSRLTPLSGSPFTPHTCFCPVLRQLWGPQGPALKVTDDHWPSTLRKQEPESESEWATSSSFPVDSEKQH